MFMNDSIRSYTHVCESVEQGIFYAVATDSINSELSVEVFEEEQKISITKVQLPSYVDGTWMCASVRLDEVYLCNQNPFHLHRVEMPSGQIISSHGQYGSEAGIPGGLHYPTLCPHTDGQKWLIFTESARGQVQAFDTTTEQWRIIIEVTKHPMGATIKDNKVYVAGGLGGRGSDYYMSIWA